SGRPAITPTQPPTLKPSSPAGSWMTPSSEALSLMMIFPMSVLLLVGVVSYTAADGAGLHSESFGRFLDDRNVGQRRLRLDLSRCAPLDATRGRPRTQGRGREHHPEHGAESVHPGPRAQDRGPGSPADSAP